VLYSSEYWTRLKITHKRKSVSWRCLGVKYFEAIYLSKFRHWVLPPRHHATVSDTVCRLSNYRPAMIAASQWSLTYGSNATQGFFWKKKKRKKTILWVVQLFLHSETAFFENKSNLYFLFKSCFTASNVSSRDWNLVHGQSIVLMGPLLNSSLRQMSPVHIQKKERKETKLRGLSPRANYTHRTTATCLRS
jgi:hypothetical protein